MCKAILHGFLTTLSELLATFTYCCSWHADYTPWLLHSDTHNMTATSQAILVYPRNRLVPQMHAATDVIGAALADAPEIMQSASSTPSFSFEHSSDSDADQEPTSPDIKAFHGESTTQHSQQGNAEASDHSTPDATPFGSHTQDNTAQSLSPQHSTDNAAEPLPAQQSTGNTQHPPSARQSIDGVSRQSTEGSARQSFESASAMPISASVASHRMRRPPLRANSTFADMDGFGRPRAAVKMVRQYHMHVGITVLLACLQKPILWHTDDTDQTQMHVGMTLL